MNLWIVTIGSSDVQLDSNQTNREKGRTEKQQSDKVWHYWYTDDLIAQHYDISFEPKALFMDKDETYRIAPRILGKVYQSSPEPVQKEIWSYFTFPLLDNFVDVFRRDSDRYPAPGAIAVLLTDQSALFDDLQRCKPESPYWQDTCALKPILQSYFKDRFPQIASKCIEFIQLQPTEQKQSLDNWNSVLDLVREQFRNLKIADQLVKIGSSDIVYASHQAGTPAISSAVQFCSLAKFENRVKFLVSNEHDATLTDIVESSTYLRGIKRDQAIKLLGHHDYLGVRDLLVEYLENDVKILLESAIQWNFAHFSEGYSLIKNNKLVKKSDRKKSFIEMLSQNSVFSDLVTKRTANDKWWWAAYEAAYLSFIRLKQGNTVEAVFHSFRSVEGLLKIWAEKKYPGELESTKHPKHQEDSRWNRSLRLYGEDLYTFLAMKRTVDKTNDFDIWVFGNIVIKRRNDLFHNIKGLNDQEDVFETWRSSNESQWKDKAEERWKARVLNCLNFIVREDFHEGFKLEEASLMVKVHQELLDAIAQL